MGEWVTRRRLPQASGAAVAGGTVRSGAAGVGTAQQTDEEWRQFGYDTANTGYAPDNTGPIDTSQEQWTYDTGDTILPSPAVVDGTVYVGVRGDNVYALDAVDGTEQWRYETVVYLRDALQELFDRT